MIEELWGKQVKAHHRSVVHLQGWVRQKKERIEKLTKNKASGPKDIWVLKNLLFLKKHIKRKHVDLGGSLQSSLKPQKTKS